MRIEAGRKYQLAQESGESQFASVASTVGQGAEFTIELPALPAGMGGTEGMATMG